RFNEGAGQVLLDSSAAGNDGFLGASSSTDSQDPQRIPTELVVGQNDAGAALLFDGVDDLCFIADTFNDFDFDSAFTMEAWVRVDTAQPNAGIVTTDGDSGILGVAGGQNAATIVVPDGDTFFQSAVGASLSLPTGTWTHHAGSFDGTTMRVYSNGQLVGSNDLNSPPESVADATAMICGYRTNVFDVPQPFAGALDEVRIWNTVRSDAEIALTALCPPIFPQTDLVGYYKFDEGFGQRIEDSSGYQNHGWLGADGLAASDDPVRIASDAPSCLAPVNDLCLDATDVSLGGVFTGSLIGANREVSSPCDSSPTTGDIWFVYTPTSVGNLTVSTCGTNDLGGVDQGVDTVLSLHRFCDGDLIACNDDDMGCASGAQGLLLDSRVTTQVLNGQSLWIRVTHAERTAPGPIQLEVEFEGGSFLDLCNGDGGDQMGCTNCPCGNNALAGTIGGCLNQAGTSTRLLPAGSLSVSATTPGDLSFDAIGGNPFTFAILVS
ncbi:MAG: LamG domain-containing protein, partial [Planctomycetota bacterium]